MRLTLYTDYALRLLMYLAAQEETRLATVGEVASAYGIARNHLTKVAHQLSRAGFVLTVRGKSGGLRLAIPAEQIVIGNVIRQTEPDMALVPCFEATASRCPITPACGLRIALDTGRQAFLAVLDGYTLADLAGRRAELRLLLATGAARPSSADTKAVA